MFAMGGNYGLHLPALIVWRILERVSGEYDIDDGVVGIDGVVV